MLHGHPKVPVLLLCFLLIAGFLPAQDLTATLFNQGMQLYARQDWAGAADYLGQVCDMNPELHQARYYLIYSLLAAKQQTKALEHAKILSEKNPSDKTFADLRDQIAKMSPIAGQAAAAPKPVPQEVILGGYTPAAPTSEPRRPEPASATAKPATKPSGDLEAAISQIDVEQFASAAQMLDAILKKEPKNQRALHYRGVAELNQRQFDKACGWFEKALALKSDNFETLFLLGDARLKSGDGKKAQDAFEKALKIRPNDVFAMLNLADAKRKQGAVKEAIEIYTRVKEIDPNVVEARLALAETLIDEGKLDEAATAVNEVLATDPENVQAHFIKGKVLYRNNLIDDAVAEMRLALTGRPDDVYIKTWLTKVLLSGFKTTEALDVAGQILKADPENFDARLLTAESLIANGEVSDARDHLDQAEKVRKSPEITRLRAMLPGKPATTTRQNHIMLYIFNKMQKTGMHPSSMPSFSRKSTNCRKP